MNKHTPFDLMETLSDRPPVKSKARGGKRIGPVSTKSRVAISRAKARGEQ